MDFYKILYIFMECRGSGVVMLEEGKKRLAALKKNLCSIPVASCPLKTSVVFLYFS